MLRLHPIPPLRSGSRGRVALPAMRLYSAAFSITQRARQLKLRLNVSCAQTWRCSGSVQMPARAPGVRSWSCRRRGRRWCRRSRTRRCVGCIFAPTPTACLCPSTTARVEHNVGFVRGGGAACRRRGHCGASAGRCGAGHECCARRAWGIGRRQERRGARPVKIGTCCCCVDALGMDTVHENCFLVLMNCFLVPRATGWTRPGHSSSAAAALAAVARSELSITVAACVAVCSRPRNRATALG
jgi:hypothetical protein